jgi:O-antigen ligase
VTAISIAVATLRVPLIGLLSFVAIATLLPFAVVPLRVGVSPTLIDVTVSAVLGACLARGLHKKDHFHLTPPTLALGVFIWLAVIALVAGTAIARLGAEEARMFVKLVNGLLLFVAVAQIVRTESELCVVLRTLMMSGMVAAVIALLIHALPPDTIATVLSALEPLGYPSGLGVLRPIVNTEALRATGTSVDPNVLGGTLMLVAALLAGQLLAPAPIFPRWAVAVGALPVLLAITLTYSRSAWVGLGIAVLYLAMVKDRRTWLAIVFAAAGLVLVPPGRAMLARLLSGFGAQDPAAALRLSEYRDAVSLISQYPLLGVGFGDPPRIDLYIGVSNLYLQMAEHMGLIGLAAFLVVVAIVTVRAFPLRIPRDEVGWGVLASLQAATVAALVAGLFDHYFFGLRFPHMVSLFWLTLGLLSAFAGLIRYEHRAGGHSVEYADARR